jgi:hypothetical protein
VNSIVRCPRTGRACSEGACRERHWCRQLFERGLSQRFATPNWHRIGSRTSGSERSYLAASPRTALSGLAAPLAGPSVYSVNASVSLALSENRTRML